MTEQPEALWLADYLERYPTDKHQRHGAVELRRLHAVEQEVIRLKAATQLCEKHQPGGGTRGHCVICSGLALQGAISRIDYALSEPNEMEVSDYDVHCNEDAVIKKAAQLKAEADRRFGIGGELIVARQERDQARNRAQYWKDEHLAGNAEIDRLRAENEGLRKDAARYRWIRSDISVCADVFDMHTEGDLDAAIDAAMKEQG